MEYKERKKWEKKFYQALKLAAKARKIKLSAERDIYKRIDPYFYHAFYSIINVEAGKVSISLSIKFQQSKLLLSVPMKAMHCALWKKENFWDLEWIHTLALRLQ